MSDRRRDLGMTLGEAAISGVAVAGWLAPWALARLLPFNTLGLGEGVALGATLLVVYGGVGAALGAVGGTIHHVMTRGRVRGYLAGAVTSATLVGTYLARARLDLLGSPAARALTGALLILLVSFALMRFLRGRGSSVVLASLLLLATCVGLVAHGGAWSEEPTDPGALEQIRRSPAPQAPLVVLGLDGVEPEILAALMESGQVPALASLWARGAHSNLESVEPTWSPPIWTTIWTGRRPEDHGITFFLSEGSYRLPGADREIVLPRLLGLKQLGDLVLEPRVVPVTSELRRATSIWEVAGLAGRRSVLANRLVSWPAQPLRGVELTSRLLLERPEIEHLTYPPELTGPALQRLESVEVAEIEGLEAAPWLRIELAKEAELWRMGVEEFLREPADLLILYTHLIDSAQHRYLKYHWPDRYRFRPQDENVAAFGGAVRATYAAVDRMVAEVLAAVAPEVRILVASDHGVRPNLALTTDVPEPQGETRMPPAPLDEVSGVHGDAPDGVFCLAGPGVRPGPVANKPHILDLAPLALRMLELPVARDLERPDPSGLLAALLGDSRPLPSVETFQGLIPRRVRTRSSVADESILEELRALGYIE